MTSVPDVRGRFGRFGGRYVPETLVAALEELTEAWHELSKDEAYSQELALLLRDFVGRPTPLFRANGLSEQLGAQIYLKREDLAHTGAHKINNAIGQALLARKLGKRRVIAETGAGQHGVATAAACALLGLECVVYMGEEDIRRQEPNLLRMSLLGAEVKPVASGSRTLKDAINEAMRDWVTNVATTYYLVGSAVGPHPYPLMVRELQAVIGTEARAQILEREGRLPDFVVACVGGGSNAIGLFHAFRADESISLVGVEAGGSANSHGAASIGYGSPGVLHGALSYLLQDEHGQVAATDSISAGLDYPSVGPEHSYLADSGRARYVAVTDEEALGAFRRLCRTEGIIPALEPAHALAYVEKLAEENPGALILVGLSGRGDKDLPALPGE